MHKAWHDHSEAIGKVAYPMGADPTGEVSKLFDVYIDDEGLALVAHLLLILMGY